MTNKPADKQTDIHTDTLIAILGNVIALCVCHVYVGRQRRIVRLLVELSVVQPSVDIHCHLPTGNRSRLSVQTESYSLFCCLSSTKTSV